MRRTQIGSPRPSLASRERRFRSFATVGLIVALVISTINPIPVEAAPKVPTRIVKVGIEKLKGSALALYKLIRDGVTYDAIKLAISYFLNPGPTPPECPTCDIALRLVRETQVDLIELKDQIPQLTAAISQSSGELRHGLLELKSATRSQIETLEGLLEGQANDLNRLAHEQEELASHVDSLAERLDVLETKVDDLAERVSFLENALIADCKDRLVATVIGEEGFRIRPTSETEIEQQSEGENLSVWVRVVLDTCTPDLTERGLLVQISAVTRGLSRDLEAYLTFNRIGGATASEMIRPALRERHRLGRPAGRLDGLVREIFVPYGGVPFDTASNQLGLAVTVFHDGELVASIPTRVLACRFGSPTRCTWER